MSDIEKIKKLRQSTGAGFKDCNAAIEEAGGDLEKAVSLDTNSDDYQKLKDKIINVGEFEN